MCTVTYLPLSEEGYILTSNRDEKTARKIALPPRKFILKDATVYFPQDQEAGGTWIATSNCNATLCLLNGAKSKHVPLSSYRLSRGKVLLDYFSFGNIKQYASGYEFKNIEPFTLIVAENFNQIKLYELVWDGQIVQLTEMDHLLPRIWSSSTLYSDNTIMSRQACFNNWLDKHKEYNSEEILELHRFGTIGDEKNNFVMNRNDVIKTVSITSIKRSKGEIKLTYLDLIESKQYKIRIM